jgi:hypothetical protein
MVTGPWNPCGLDSNVLKINKATTVSFNELSARAEGSNFVLKAASTDLAIVNFEFYGNQPPTEGTYTIQVNSGVIADKKVRITADISSLSTFTASSGTVYVAVNGTTTMVSFCGVTFTSTNTGATNTTGGANIMWTP